MAASSSPGTDTFKCPTAALNPHPTCALRRGHPRIFSHFAAGDVTIAEGEGADRALPRLRGTPCRLTPRPANARFARRRSWPRHSRAAPQPQGVLPFVVNKPQAAAFVQAVDRVALESLPAHLQTRQAGQIDGDHFLPRLPHRQPIRLHRRARWKITGRRKPAPRDSMAALLPAPAR